MAESSPKKVLVQHDRPATLAEIEAFRVIHNATDRIVLMPVVVNGDPRFALALLSRNDKGEQYLQLLAHLVLPTDEVLDTQGNHGCLRPPTPSKDLN